MSHYQSWQNEYVYTPDHEDRDVREAIRAGIDSLEDYANLADPDGTMYNQDAEEAREAADEFFGWAFQSMKGENDAT